MCGNLRAEKTQIEWKSTLCEWKGKKSIHIYLYSNV